jgi:hypothetical protein
MANGYYVTVKTDAGSYRIFVETGDAPPSPATAQLLASVGDIAGNTLSPQAAVLAVAASDSPKTSNKLGASTDFWNSSIRNWVLLAAGVGLTLGLIFALRSSGSKSSPTQNLTQAQAQVAQDQLAQQISSTTGALKAAGYSQATIQRARNQVALEYGTRIVERTIARPSQNIDTNHVVLVTGVASPDHYASLDQIDTREYLKSLSVSPNAADITRNTAIVHNLSTDIPR